MKVVINSSELYDANAFGELLRGEFFIEQKNDRKNHYGCYTTFKIRDDFKKITSIDKEKMSILIFNAIHGLTPKEFIYEVENDPDTYKSKEDIDKTTIYTNGIEWVGWYWDGDGTLAVSDGERIAVNDDCKKDYEWKWFEV